MAWTRFDVWDRWRDLSRFRVAAEAAMATEHQRWQSLPIENIESITIADPVPGGRFSCSLSDFRTALGNKHLLYAMLLASYVGLVEESGRDLIEHAVSSKNIPYANFPGLSAAIPISDAAEDYVMRNPVEVWGLQYLNIVGRGWSDVGGGLSGIVEAIALRNLTSHGLITVTKRAHNRMVSAGVSPAKWPVGQHVEIDKPIFNDCLQNLRAFARALAQCASDLP